MSNSDRVVNLDDKFGKVVKQRTPYVIAQMNDVHVKCVKPIGEFVWHKHDDTDELFFVHKGHLVIHYRDREVHLRAGEMHVVPRGVEHKPFAESECEVLLIEPAGTLNTGDAGGALTVAQEAWI
jgi:mannose-6-phosphate isomerase-like protein (cupin superfamily)